MNNGFSQKERKYWMEVLAAASVAELERAWERLGQRPAYEFLRRPETGMVMVRAKADGNGAPFNFGEIPVTRCTVRVTGGASGCAYVKGTLRRHAELAAVMDALLQREETREEVRRKAILPVVRRRAVERKADAEKTDATKVDFFTMVRGE